MEIHRLLGESSGELPPLNLALALLCPLTVLAFSYKLGLNIERKIVISVTRTIVQLLLAGYVLLSFVFSLHSPFAVAAYLLMMSLIASLEVTSRQVRSYHGHFMDSLKAVLLGGGVIGAFGGVVVFHPSPWWNPHIIVPTCGMIIGNSISGPSVAVDRLLAEVSDKRHEPEVRLSFGASRFEAVLPIFRAAVLAALMPNLNLMAVVGLVSIPGMMTGQLLGGASPLAAAEYQMAILWLIFATAAVSTYTGLYFANIHAAFDSKHRITPHRVLLTKGKTEIDAALYRSIMQLFSSLRAIFSGLRSGSIGQPSTSNSYEIVPVDADVEIPSQMQNLSTLPSPLAKENKGGKVSVSIIQNDADWVDRYEVCGDSRPLLRALSVNIQSGEQLLFPPEGLSIDIKSGEVLCLEGPSGIGKSRLLRAFSQLDELPLGSLSLLAPSNVPVEEDIPNWRRRCMYVPQALPPLAGSPEDFIKECCGYSSRCSRPETPIILSRMDVILSSMERSLGLDKDKMKSPWNSLSGGERQRAVIGCSLILSLSSHSIEDFGRGKRLTSDCIILFDEPTAACDSSSCLLVEKAIIESGVAAIIVTHDSRQSTRLANRRMVFNQAI